MMNYLDYVIIIFEFLLFWFVFLFFLRVIHRYPHKSTSGNTWKKDIIVSFIQCIVVLFSMILFREYF